jgi:hypothetical protein
VKVITMEEISKRIENTRSRSKAVFQSYNSELSVKPLVNVKQKERDPDEKQVLDRFKLK